MTVKKKPAKKPDFFQWLRSGLRKLSQRHPPLYEAKADAKRPYVGDNPRQKVCYECAKCKSLVSTKECAVDHIEDAGSLKGWEDLEGFARRLFCGKEGLQLLCHSCHDIKTYMVKHGVSEEQAIIEKEVINILKTESKEDIINFIEMFDFENKFLTNNEKERRIALTEIFTMLHKGEWECVNLKSAIK